MRAPILPLPFDEPPRRVLTDARTAFGEVLSGRLLRLVSKFETAFPTSVTADGDEVGDEVGDDVLMFKDDELVVFMWSRRVPGGSRVTTEVFGGGATTIARLRRSARHVTALISRRVDRFESGTVPTGPACLLVDSRAGAVAKKWHSEWVTL